MKTELIKIAVLTSLMTSGTVYASECSTNECGSGSIGISDTDSNAIYNDQILNPTVTT